MQISSDSEQQTIRHQSQKPAFNHGEIIYRTKMNTTIKRRDLNKTLTERGECETEEGKAEALVCDAKLGAIRERLTNGGLWNEIGEVWRRRAAEKERRWWWG